jgi:hypothetical protein
MRHDAAAAAGYAAADAAAAAAVLCHHALPVAFGRLAVHAMQVCVATVSHTRAPACQPLRLVRTSASAASAKANAPACIQ